MKSKKTYIYKVDRSLWLSHAIKCSRGREMLKFSLVYLLIYTFPLLFFFFFLS